MVQLKEPVQLPPRTSLLYNNANNSSSRIKETNKVKLSYNPLSKRQVLNTYDILGTLGNGQYGKVKLARDLTTGELVAIKILNRFERKSGYSLQGTVENPRIEQEIEIMKRCHHENIVKLYEILNDPESTKVYLVLEYCSRGPVKWCPENQLEIKAVGPSILTFGQARKILSDVVSGLEYLHSQGITHRDIKPSNLLISSNGTVKISDFGVSILTAAENTNIQSSHEQISKSKTLGTPAFFAPELCTTEGDYRCSSAIDIWSLGVTLYCMLFGKLPFNANSGLELFDNIISKPLSFPSYEQVSKRGHPNLTREEYNDAKDILNRLLKKNPSERITLAEIKTHSFMCRYGNSAVVAKSISTDSETFSELKVPQHPPPSSKKAELLNLPINSSFSSLDSVYMENFDRDNLRSDAERNPRYSPSPAGAGTLSPPVYHNINSRESSFSSFSSFTSSTAFTSQISIQDAPPISNQYCSVDEDEGVSRINSCAPVQYRIVPPFGEHSFENTQTDLSPALTPVGDFHQQMHTCLQLDSQVVKENPGSKREFKTETDGSIVLNAGDAQHTRRQMSIYKL
ncbi:serine/threonine protein kinase TOS3 [Saccharomyces eubayanus]|uniref:serine/threonine protein kinase TOS3 n=1 Tax=Saccharomyces eubayanus TaxID=1080349 RepID=UPI0006C3E5C3|nr:TOS3-like protein [Saccharomyces eubayanus]KOG99348.1 TOS3-like protein [Saccharomyces eubayanus]